jgi:hypothetical protein
LTVAAPKTETNNDASADASGNLRGEMLHGIALLNPENVIVASDQADSERTSDKRPLVCGIN